MTANTIRTALYTHKAGCKCHQQPRLEAQNIVNIPDACQTLLGKNKREKNSLKASVIQANISQIVITVWPSLIYKGGRTFWFSNFILVQPNVLRGKRRPGYLNSEFHAVKHWGWQRCPDLFFLFHMNLCWFLCSLFHSSLLSCCRGYFFLLYLAQSCFKEHVSHSAKHVFF